MPGIPTRVAPWRRCRPGPSDARRLSGHARRDRRSSPRRGPLDPRPRDGRPHPPHEVSPRWDRQAEIHDVDPAYPGPELMVLDRQCHDHGQHHVGDGPAQVPPGHNCTRKRKSPGGSGPGLAARYGGTCSQARSDSNLCHVPPIGRGINKPVADFMVTHALRHLQGLASGDEPPVPHATVAPGVFRQRTYEGSHQGLPSWETYATACRWPGSLGRGPQRYTEG